MENTGHIRKIDDLGRVVIPKEIRNRLKITKNSPLEIFADDSSITITKLKTSCCICGSTKKLIKFKNKSICKKCVREVAKI